MSTTDNHNNDHNHNRNESQRPAPRRLLGEDISERLLRIGMGALRLADKLPRTEAGKHVARQLIRACTSGGANYEEARSAESKHDFAHKALVAAKEVGETVYWLRVIHGYPLSSNPELPLLIREGRELVAILTASARTARRSAG